MVHDADIDDALKGDIKYCIARQSVANQEYL